MRTRAQALARAVKNRRTSLGLAQGDLRANGGPGVVVVGQVERGCGPTPQALADGAGVREVARATGLAPATVLNIQQPKKRGKP